MEEIIKGLCDCCNVELEILCKINNSEDRLYFDYLMDILDRRTIIHSQLEKILGLKPEGCTNQKWIVSCMSVIELYEKIQKGEVKLCCDGKLTLATKESVSDSMKEVVDMLNNSGITCGLREVFSPLNPLKQDDELLWLIYCGEILGIREESNTNFHHI